MSDEYKQYYENFKQIGQIGRKPTYSSFKSLCWTTDYRVKSRAMYEFICEAQRHSLKYHVYEPPEVFDDDDIFENPLVRAVEAYLEALIVDPFDAEIVEETDDDSE